MTEGRVDIGGRAIGAAGTARDRAFGRTRAEILDAAASLLVDEHPAAITVPAVAARAGVSVRTVYRHFPRKADLLDATSRRFLDRAGAGRAPASTTELGAHLHRMWKEFDVDREAVRAEHTSAAGRELRARRLALTRPVVRAIVDDEAPALTPTERHRLADLVIALTSSSTYLELVDRQGWAADDAAATVEWAVAALLRAAADRQGDPS